MASILISLVIGYFIGHQLEMCKNICSKLILSIIIPVLIFWNLTHIDPQRQLIFLDACLSFFFVYFIFALYTKDAVKALSSSYLNIGVIGYPMITYLLGNDTSDLVITCFAAGSVTGSVCGVFAFTSTDQTLNFRKKLSKLMMSPSFVSLILAIACNTLQIQLNFISTDIYLMCKTLLPILGGFTLGCWFKKTPIFPMSIKQELLSVAERCCIYYFACLVVYAFFHYEFALEANQDLCLIMLMMPFLPSATNIVLMETYYNKTGQTSTMVGRSSLMTFVFFGVTVLLLRLLSAF